MIFSRVRDIGALFGRSMCLQAFRKKIMSNKFRVFATCDIGPAIELLRKRGYDVGVYPHPEAPPKNLIIDKVKSGVDGLITTLRDQIDAEIFEAGKKNLKGLAHIAVGFYNLDPDNPTKHIIPFTHPTPPPTHPP